MKIAITSVMKNIPPATTTPNPKNGSSAYMAATPDCGLKAYWLRLTETIFETPRSSIVTP